MEEKEQNCEENPIKEEKISENGEVNNDVSFF